MTGLVIPFAACNGFGRPIFGWLTDRLTPKRSHSDICADHTGITGSLYQHVERHSVYHRLLLCSGDASAAGWPYSHCYSSELLLASRTMPEITAWSLPPMALVQ